jgi:hypothetical protein
VNACATPARAALPPGPITTSLARAYNRATHFRTGEPTDPAWSFEPSLGVAREQKADRLVPAGDDCSFHSEPAVSRQVGLPATSATLNAGYGT